MIARVPSRVKIPRRTQRQQRFLLQPPTNSHQMRHSKPRTPDRASLEAELLEAVKQGTPAFFEQLVIDLLVKMGYGGSRPEAARAVGRSGDGGLDGVIDEDRLGLDAIYVQAKRWESDVGRPEIQKFAGASRSARKEGALHHDLKFHSQGGRVLSARRYPPGLDRWAPIDFANV